MRRFARDIGGLGLLALGLGCSSEPPSSEAGDDGGSETAAEDEYSPPVFIDPGSGTLSLTHNQLMLSPLRVSDVVVGRTRLEIDGRSVGTLASPGPVGHLEADILRLRLDGAMLQGMHSLRLVTPGTTAPQASSDIEVRISPVTRPKLTFELGASVIASGEHAQASGLGERGLLLILAQTDPQTAELSMIRLDGATWSGADVRSVPLPGYVSDPDPVAPAAAAAAVLLGDGGETEADRVRVAWRVGGPGFALDALELEWGEDENVIGETERVFDVDEVSGVEWARVDYPAFVGDNLAIDVHARTDAETPLPGDEALFTIRWPEHGPPAPAQLTSFGARVDTEILGPAIDLARGEQALGLRMDARRMAVMRWDANSASPTLIDPGFATTALEGPLPASAAVLGAFGSHTTAAVTGDGELRVLLDDTSFGKARTAHPSVDALPAMAPSGALAATVAWGTPVFLVPYANKAEVVALLVDGETTAVQVLAGLFCDEIALPAAETANEKGSMSFACVQAGDVRLGALFAGPGGG